MFINIGILLAITRFVVEINRLKNLVQTFWVKYVFISSKYDMLDWIWGIKYIRKLKVYNTVNHIFEL